MKLITCDWETFYSREYSLSKMTTQEYILSPHFEVIGISINVDGEKTVWKSDHHPNMKEWLQQFPWDEALVAAHNAMFDGAILEWIFDCHPKMYHCTMMSSRPLIVPFTPRGKMALATVAKYYNLPPKGTEVHNAIGLRRRDFNTHALKRYEDYCCHDTEISKFIAKKHLPQLPLEEIQLISATIKKFTQPVLELDIDVLLERQAVVAQEKLTALTKAGLHDRDMLMSNDKFAAALLLFGVIPPTKISPRTGKETYAFAKVDLAFQELLEHEDVRVQLIVAARLKLRSTQEETRLKRFIDVYYAMKATGMKFAVPLMYWAAHTGRFGGWDKLNLQNLGRASALRKAITAPDGSKIIAGDLSQIEARITAVLAGQDDLVEAFRQGKDVYSLFASDLYGFDVTKANTKERFVGKTCILGLGFGVAHETLRNSLLINKIDVTLSECIGYVTTYRTKFSKIKGLWKFMDKEVIPAMANGVRLDLGFGMHTELNAIVLPNGLRLNYPELKIDAEGNAGYTNWCYNYRGQTKSLYGAKLVENIVQALARIVIARAEIYLLNKGHPAAMQVHDELIYVKPDAQVAKFTKALEAVLVLPVPWMPTLPVACEVAHGQNYAEAK